MKETQTQDEMKKEIKQLLKQIKKHERENLFLRNAHEYEVLLIKQQNLILKRQLDDQNEFIGRKWLLDPMCIPATLDDAEKMLKSAIYKPNKQSSSF